MSRDIPHFYWYYEVQYIPHYKIFNGLICIKIIKKKKLKEFRIILSPWKCTQKQTETWKEKMKNKLWITWNIKNFQIKQKWKSCIFDDISSAIDGRWPKIYHVNPLLRPIGYCATMVGTGHPFYILPMAVVKQYATPWPPFNHTA